MIDRLRKFVDRNIDEIATDRALKIYGACLALTHLLSLYNWKTFLLAAVVIARDTDPICWPFFEHCEVFRLLSVSVADGLLWIYGAAAVAALALFLSAHRIRAAYATLIAVEIFKLFILLQDYRLRQNHHYMALFTSAAFLFFPDKKKLLQYLLVFFYFWAGTLKLNSGWLSGDNLYPGRPWPFYGRGVAAACGYVVFLELVAVWGVLARRPLLFWAVFCQLILFHLVSWSVVGPFYPLLMFSLLAIFPLNRLLSGSAGGLLPDLIEGRERIATYFALGFLSLLQLFPYAYPGDNNLRGEGRLFSLYMFHARNACAAHLVLHYKNGRLQTVDVSDVPMTLTRVKCEPTVFYNVAKNWCRKLASSANFLDLDLYLDAARARSSTLKPLIAQKNFCRAGLKNRLFGSNSWILTAEP